MYEATEAFLRDLNAEVPQSPERLELLRTMVERVAQFAQFESDTSELRVAATALDELLDASELFAPWRDRPKLAAFGSARTAQSDPLYQMAEELSRRMADEGWMSVTGAGPGIMEASARGAGRDHTLGVNIELPFEQFPSPYIDIESKLVTMQYFFTRKVALTRPSNAFVAFPGGFGTMDEIFEILTLIHTGKTTPAPVVLVDTPRGSYWQEWRHFVESQIVGGGYINPPDLCLCDFVTSVDDARSAILNFYGNYVSTKFEHGRAFIEVRRPLRAEDLASLRQVAQIFNEGHGFQIEEPTLFSCNFDGRNYVNLRLLINAVNAL